MIRRPPRSTLFPSTPLSRSKNPAVVLDEEDRPQPRRDVNGGNGMAAVVGRVRECPLLDVKLTLLSHNLVRGAAGAALLNAELLAARGFLKHREVAAQFPDNVLARGEHRGQVVDELSHR